MYIFLKFRSNNQLPCIIKYAMIILKKIKNRPANHMIIINYLYEGEKEMIEKNTDQTKI